MMLPEKLKPWLVPLILTLLALVLRVAIMPNTTDGPGDGPNRALQAYAWSLHPYLVKSEYYPPGYMYINGVLMWLLRDPQYTVRIMNCIWGSLSIGVFFLLAQRVFGFYPALLSGLTLLLMPLHVGLSVSSLSEPLANLLVYSSMLTLIVAAERFATGAAGKYSPLVWCLIFFFIGCAVRCETWTLIPLWFAYFGLRTKNWKAAFAILPILSAFPLYWCLSCFIDIGQPLVSFGGGEDFRNKPISLVETVNFLFSSALSFAGPLVAFGTPIAAGTLAWRLYKRLEGEQFGERLFYLVVFCQFWLIAFVATTRWGYNLQTRYLLFGLSLAMPILYWCCCEFIPWLRTRLTASAFKLRLWGFTAFSIFAIDAMLLTALLMHPYINATQEKHPELHSAADWFRRTGNEHKGTLFMGMNYRSYFVPLYCPPLAEHYNVAIHFWTPWLTLADRLVSDPPEFLIVGTDDGADLTDTRSVVDFQIDKTPVFNQGYVSIYKIIPGSMRKVEHPVLPYCFWYPSKPNLRTLFLPPRKIGE